MKKIILLFFCLVQFSFSFCQERKWLKDNAEWYYTVIADMGRYTGYVKYHNVRDTVVAGKDCRVMDVIYPNQDFLVSDIPYHIITREEGDILYYYVRNNFHVLYDFSKDVGDTIKVVVPENTYNEDTIGYLIVEQVKSHEIGGYLYRTQMLKVSQSGIGTSNFVGAIAGWVIEGIGSDHSFYPFHVLSCDNACPVELRCYSDNDINLRLVDYACDTTYMSTSTYDVLLHGSDLKISPNPVSPFGNIKLSIKGATESESIFFEILSMNGRKLHSGTATIGNGILINAISPGIYFLKIEMNDKIYVEKLVVQ